jgi:multiple sugar transport system permease protein
MEINHSSSKYKISQFFDKNFYFFLLVPTIIITAFAIVFPLLYSLATSFTDATILNFLSQPRFIGIENYVNTLASPEFLNSLKIGLLFSFFSVVIELFFGFVIAHFVYSFIKSTRSFVIACILAPLMLTPAVVALMWKFMLDYQIGIVNYLTKLLGLGMHPWLADPKLAFWSIVFADAWQQIPFVFLIILAGLESLPQEPYEAAKVDGATKWQTLRYLTLPFLKGPIFVALIFRLIDSFKIFDKINVLTGGGPGTATEALNVYMYRIGFQQFQIGQAASISQVIIFLIMALFWLFLRINSGLKDD